MFCSTTRATTTGGSARLTGQGQLVWCFGGQHAGFGHAINDGRPFWIGDFNGDGRADVLFYYPGDDNWWLGSLTQVPGENPQ